jgi:hypothetical protein
MCDLACPCTIFHVWRDLTLCFRDCLDRALGIEEAHYSLDSKACFFPLSVFRALSSITSCDA